MAKKSEAEKKKKNKVSKEKVAQRNKKRGTYRKRNFMSLTTSGKKQRVSRTIDAINDRNEAIRIHSTLLKKFPTHPVRKMSVLWLIKKLRLSMRSLTDLRFWIMNCLREGVDFNTFPQAQKVFSWAKRTMLPPGVKVEESAATVPLQSILTTTIVR